MRALYVLCIWAGCTVHGQTALYNSGGLRIHDSGNLGFHTNLINNALLDQNLGRVGFYGNQNINVSGFFAPVFNNVEIGASGGVTLDVGINTLNETNFDFGDVITPRQRPDVFYHFLQNALDVGANDVTKINGYAAISNQQDFIFPIGDVNELRPLILTSDAVNTFAKCAYFRDNPNSPTTFTGFDTSRLGSGVTGVSNVEFWHLEGEVPSSIRVSWNENSAVSSFAPDAESVILVGFSNTTNQWEPLSEAGGVGSLTEGFVTSITFVPDDYGALTFGTNDGANVLLDLNNYFVSPNGDGVNDAFVLDELSDIPESANNQVSIYDRFGLKVFEMENYTADFVGYSNMGNLVIDREKGLPAGVYFYTVHLKDMDKKFQGFLYLAR